MKPKHKPKRETPKRILVGYGIKRDRGTNMIKYVRLYVDGQVEGMCDASEWADIEAELEREFMS